MDKIKTLETLCASHGPSGDEREVAALLRELVAPYGDDCRIDTMGNLILHKKGKGPKLMFAAHMDSIGLIVTHIEKDGYLRFGPVGHLFLGSVIRRAFRFRNGVIGVVALAEKVKEKDMEITDLYLDIGAKTREEAQALVNIGDTAVSAETVFTMGSKITGPFLDNRISCLILVEAIKKIRHHDSDLYFVFSVQEELDLRGAKTAAFALDPDYGIAVDVTWGDEPESMHRGSSKLGGGAAIKVMDHSVVAHPEMVARLEQLAIENKIPYQRDVGVGGGTDAGAIHQSRSGVLTGGICIPCRYIHSPVETVELSDVEAAINLVVALAESHLPSLPKSEER